MFKKFRSPGLDIRISNTLGFTAIIGKDFVNVHQSLWRDAYSEGAISEDVLAVAMDYIAEKKEEQKAVVNEEREAIKTLMRDSILDRPTDFLDKDNNIIYRKVVALTKKTHKKDYFETIWKEIIDEAK
jgi:hypothetical protein